MKNGQFYNILTVRNLPRVFMGSTTTSTRTIWLRQFAIDLQNHTERVLQVFSRSDPMSAGKLRSTGTTIRSKAVERVSYLGDPRNKAQRTRLGSACMIHELMRLRRKAEEPAFRADLRRAEAPGELIAQVEEALGPVAFLVSNAGLAKEQQLEEVRVEDFDETIAINLRSPFCSRNARSRECESGILVAFSLSRRWPASPAESSGRTTRLRKLDCMDLRISWPHVSLSSMSPSMRLRQP